jgi:hypothetical protein
MRKRVSLRPEAFRRKAFGQPDHRSRLKLATLETFENLGRATRQTPLAHERDVARQSPAAQGSLSKKR